MIDFDVIGEDLFNKIRGRFPEVTIGDEEGTITNEPTKARFFDFDYKEGATSLGKVSVSISEDEGLTIIYSKDFVEGQDQMTQTAWYDFLKELRIFSKKRMLDFSVRDINKSNLNKRDYKFLANRSGDDKMTESKLYGTSRVSYQKVGEARLVIKHTENINVESTTGRTQKIGKIYIESPEGERFKYPYKHLSGARAMARHVAEGGNAYDDFGKHIQGLSEEMAKLRKFKNYMGRSAVMAESLAGYMDIVKERISTVKKTIENLQKPAYYKETFEAFEAPVFEDVPSDVAENWIDELTIKQFNEELADVFPYIYNLVKEGTKAKALGPDELAEISQDTKDKYIRKASDSHQHYNAVRKDAESRGDKDTADKARDKMKKRNKGMTAAFGESGLQYYTGVKKHGKEYMKKAAQAGREGASQEELGRLKDKYSKAAKKTKEEFELEQAFEDTMGQFSDHVCEDCGNPSWRTFTEAEKQKGLDGKACWKGYRRMGTKMKGGRRVDNCVKVKEDDLDEAYVKTSKDAIDTLGNLRKIGKKIETGQDTFDGNLANMYVSDVYDVISWVENNLDTNDANYKKVLGPVIELRKKAKGMERELGSGKDARFGNEIVNTLYPLMQWIGRAALDAKEGNAYAHTVRKAKMDGKKKGDKIQGPDGDEITLEKEAKTPLGEFILSYYDRETGEFPKGETAVLTMVEKDYGEQFIEPAKAFIESIHQTFEAFQQSQPMMSDDTEYNRMRELAGLR